jgi:ArsR family metal-binding transcriptional regulator
MVALYPRRITIAKADEIVDAWLTLERIRQLVERTWADREHIAPCFETRKRPPTLEIYKRLPGTNCGQCGVATCLALATQAWMGAMSPRLCRPVFGEDGLFTHLKEPLLEICAGMGIIDLIQKE